MKIATGFHRMGVVIAAPFIVVAVSIPLIVFGMLALEKLYAAINPQPPLQQAHRQPGALFDEDEAGKRIRVTTPVSYGSWSGVITVEFPLGTDEMTIRQVMQRATGTRPAGMFDDLIPASQSTTGVQVIDYSGLWLSFGLLVVAAIAYATCWSIGWIVAGFRSG